MMNECYFYTEPRNHVLYSPFLQRKSCSTTGGTKRNQTEPRARAEDLRLCFHIDLCRWFSYPTVCGRTQSTHRWLLKALDWMRMPVNPYIITGGATWD